MPQEDIYRVLKDTFGYSEFRHNQKEVIRNVLAKIDSLVIMPTGGGKSICYQLPALLLDGITIVISPLIALMNDQVVALKQLGIKAATLHSNVSASARAIIVNEINQGKLKLLYLSPEGLLNRDTYLFVKQLNISLFAIDEAHCVSVWGNDFRPDYVKLSFIKDEFPDTPVIALTATADASTQQDIVKQLRLKSEKRFLSSFERTNISVQARSGQKRIEQIYEFINGQNHSSGIIYCLSRNNTEKIASKLKERGYKADFYHAGRSSDDRKVVQAKFQNDELTIICATIAFGMGIDKPNIRWVIHYNMPKNIEGYYQEIGRAGRDGQDASALLFYGWGDYTQLKRFIDEGVAEKTFKEVQLAKLERMWQFANALNCRTNFILNYFGEYKTKTCGRCDNCLSPPKYIDATTYGKMAISGIIRANQNINQAFLIDLLRGSHRQEVFALGLNHLKTFGVGREVPYKHWVFYINQMINQGIISVDFSDLSRLKITPLSKELLKDERQLELAEYFDQRKLKNEKPKKLKVDITNYNEDFYEKLKQWRVKLAKLKKVPSYVIFHDRTLKAIAASMPKTKNDLLSLDGIGKKKLADYGDDILEMTGG